MSTPTKRILNAFDLAPVRTKEIKPTNIRLKPGQYLDSNGKVINDQALKVFRVFTPAAPADPNRIADRILFETMRERYRLAK